MRVWRDPRYVSLKRASDVLRVRSPFQGRLRYWFAVGVDSASVVEEGLGVLGGRASKGGGVAALINCRQELGGQLAE